jgi:hypothetical protein
MPVLLLALIVPARGQNLPDEPSAGETRIQTRIQTPTRTRTMFAIFGAEIVADGVTTRILYQRHYPETDPLARPFVQAGVPGQIAGSLLGAGAVGAMWLALHRTHHERAARWFLRSVEAGEGVNVARQFAVLRSSRN